MTTSAVNVTADVTLQSGGEIASGAMKLYSPTGPVVVSTSLSSANRISGSVANGVYRVILTLPQGIAAGTYRWGINMNRTASVDTSSYGFEGMTPIPVGLPATITVVNTAPADPFITWATSYGLNGPAATRDADPDGDGIKNLIEYESGTDPKSGLMQTVGISGNTISQPGLPQITLVGTGDQQRLRVVYLHRLGDSTVTATVQFSDNATSWTNTTHTPTVVATSAAFEALAIEDDIFVPAKEVRFAKVNFTYTP